MTSSGTAQRPGAIRARRRLGAHISQVHAKSSTAEKERAALFAAQANVSWLRHGFKTVDVGAIDTDGHEKYRALRGKVRNVRLEGIMRIGCADNNAAGCGAEAVVIPVDGVPIAARPAPSCRWRTCRSCGRCRSARHFIISRIATFRAPSNRVGLMATRPQVVGVPLPDPETTSRRFAQAATMTTK